MPWEALLNLTLSPIEPIQPEQKRWILVVDDDEFQHKIVDMVLGQVHYQMAFASSGEDAIQFLQHTAVALVLMDVQMPGLGGIETTRQLRAMPHLAHVPILMASGDSDEQVLAQCLQAGASDIVLKPFNRTTLPAQVASFCGLANERRDGS